MEAAASLESDSASLTSRSFVAAAIGTADSSNKVSAKAKQMLRTSQASSCALIETCRDMLDDFVPARAAFCCAASKAL